MNTTVLIVAIVVGGGISVAIIAELRDWWLKNREIKLKEKQLSMDEKLHTDEMNAAFSEWMTWVYPQRRSIALLKRCVSLGRKSLK